jgi:hypothetical protein
MADIIEEDPPESGEIESEEDEDEDIEEGEGVEEPVLTLETNEEAVTYELYKTPSGFEVVVVEEPDEGEKPDAEHVVCIATSLKELDEGIECLQQLREKMKELTLRG